MSPGNLELGECAEQCGKGHELMPIVVKVVSEADYEEWVTNYRRK